MIKANKEQKLYLNALKTLFILGAYLAFIYSFPRAIVSVLGIDSPWTSYLYMYGLGGVFFLTGIWLILKSGACQFKRGHDAFWFKILMWGFVYVASLHAIWILFALYWPTKAGV